VASEEELATKATIAGHGDFVRVSTSFGAYHAGDLLVWHKEEGSEGYWAQIHGEEGDITKITAGEGLELSADSGDGSVGDITINVKDSGITTDKIAEKNVTEAKLAQNVQDALALARTALQEHQSLDGYKEKQTAVADKGLTGAKVLGSLTQNENGEIDYAVRDLTPADIGAQVAGDYATRKEVADQDAVVLAEAQKYTDDAIDDLHVIATSGSIYDVAEGANDNTGADKEAHPKYLIFNCGSATTVI
jgi:hypothetical protein